MSVMSAREAERLRFLGIQFIPGNLVRQMAQRHKGGHSHDSNMN